MKKALLSIWVSYVAIAFIYMEVNVFNWSSTMRFALLAGAFVVWMWNEIMVLHDDYPLPDTPRITPTLGDKDE
jgi:hypothetical protein